MFSLLLDSSATAPKITEKKNTPDHLVSKDNSGVLITLTTTNYKRSRLKLQNPTAFSPFRKAAD